MAKKSNMSFTLQANLNKGLMSLFENVEWVDEKQMFIVYIDKKATRTDRSNTSEFIQKKFSSIGATYKKPAAGASPGVVKIGNTNGCISVKADKPKPLPLKPAHIGNGQIVDKFKTPKQIYDAIIKHVDNIPVDDMGVLTKDELISLVNDTYKSKGNPSIDFRASATLVPAEFFELLSSIKLSLMIANKDDSIAKILSLPENLDIKINDIKINFPGDQTLGLLDYYINYKGTNKISDSLKISVKSKLSGSSNPVKFGDIFNTKNEVERWFRKLKETKINNQGQKIIAESAVEGNAITGRGILYPLISVNDLLNSSTVSNNVRKVIKKIAKGTVFSDDDVDALKRVLEQFNKQLKNSQVKGSTLLSSIGKDKEGNFTNKNDIVDSKDIEVITKMLSKSFTTSKQYNTNVANLSVMCEKILTQSSRKESDTKFNFFQMFFDEVLIRKTLSYAVITKTGKNLNYVYKSAINWDKSTWVALRGQNSLNDVSNALGLDV